MRQVLLPDQTAQKLKRVAAQQGIDATQLLVQLVEEHLADEWQSPEMKMWPERAEEFRKIAQEQQYYEKQHAFLLTQYKGQYIAMHDGQVVDQDTDRVALSRRIRQSYGNTPVLITPVLEEPRQTIMVRSPRLVEAGE